MCTHLWGDGPGHACCQLGHLDVQTLNCSECQLPGGLNAAASIGLNCVIDALRGRVISIDAVLGLKLTGQTSGIRTNAAVDEGEPPKTSTYKSQRQARLPHCEKNNRGVKQSRKEIPHIINIHHTGSVC